MCVTYQRFGDVCITASFDVLFFEKYGSESLVHGFVHRFLRHVKTSIPVERCVVGARWASHRTLHMLGCGRMMDNNVYITRAITRQYCQRMMKGCPFCWKRILRDVFPWVALRRNCFVILASSKHLRFGIWTTPKTYLLNRFIRKWVKSWFFFYLLYKIWQFYSIDCFYVVGPCFYLCREFPRHRFWFYKLVLQMWFDLNV